MLLLVLVTAVSSVLVFLSSWILFHEDAVGSLLRLLAWDPYDWPDRLVVFMFCGSLTGLGTPLLVHAWGYVIGRLAASGPKREKCKTSLGTVIDDWES